jgi:hypothetical protein
MPKKPRDEEDLLAKALHAYNTREFSSLRKAADHYRVSYSKLRGRKNGQTSLSDRPTTNNALNSNQENALISWIELLNSCYTPPKAKDIEIAANRLLKMAGSERVVGPMYSYRLIRRLPPHIKLITQKPKESLRIQAEDPGVISHWYDRLEYLYREHGFEPHEIYNWDETGFQNGEGLNQHVVSTRQTASIATGDRGETITGIECIAADGWVMFPWFLVKGSVHMEDWYSNMSTSSSAYKVIHLTSSGWTDSETAYRWLCSFHEATKNRVRRGRPRLLLMDNHASHTTIEFLDFCKENLIIPWYFVPHTTHLCQPLDAEAFLSLKHHFKMANTEVMAWGGSNEKRDFFREIDAVRHRALRSKTIQTSFKSTGIWPLDPKQVLDNLGQYSDEETLRMYDEPSPSPAREFPSSATNSPPNSYSRIAKLEKAVFPLLDDTSPDLRKIRKHIRRAIDAGKSSLYNAELAEMSLTRALSHKTPGKKPKSKRWVKGATKSPLSSISGNKLVQRRCEKEDESKLRAWRKDAVKMAADLAAKELEETLENEEDDTLLANEAIDGLYFMDPGPYTSKK